MAANENYNAGAILIIRVYPCVSRARRGNPVAVRPDPIALPHPVATNPDSIRKGRWRRILNEHRRRSPAYRDSRRLRDRGLHVNAYHRRGRRRFVGRFGPSIGFRLRFPRSRCSSRRRRFGCWRGRGFGCWRGRGFGCWRGRRCSRRRLGRRWGRGGWRNRCAAAGEQQNNGNRGISHANLLQHLNFL
jgi:hypothetical protein